MDVYIIERVGWEGEKDIFEVFVDIKKAKERLKELRSSYSLYELNTYEVK